VPISIIKLYTAHRIVVENPEVKRPLGKPKRRREGNFKMDLAQVGMGV